MKNCSLKGKMNTLTALEKVGADKEAIFVQEISAIIRKGP